MYMFGPHPSSLLLRSSKCKATWPYLGSNCDFGRRVDHHASQSLPALDPRHTHTRQTRIASARIHAPYASTTMAAVRNHKGGDLW